jgi:hypothetical protein
MPQFLQVRDKPLRLEQAFVPEDRIKNHRPFRRKFELFPVKISPEDRAHWLIGEDLTILPTDAGKIVQDRGIRCHESIEV